MNETRSIHFRCYIALLIWAALPLGSSPLWAQSLLCFFFCLLSLGTLRSYLCGGASLSSAIYNARYIIVLLLISVCWQLVQTLTLPVSLITAISPVRSSLAIAPVDTLSISTTSAYTLQSAVLAFTYLQCMLLTLLLVNKRERLRALLFIMLSVGVAEAVLGGIASLAGWTQYFWYDKQVASSATGSFTNRNQYANYLTLCLSMGLGLLLSEASEHSRENTWRNRLRSTLDFLLGNTGYLRMLLPLVIAGIILSRSRMGNIALIFSMIGAFSLYFILTKRAGKMVLSLLLSLLILDFVVFGSIVGMERMLMRFETVTESAEARYTTHQHAIDMLRDFWLTGSGAGTFQSIFTAYSHTPLDRIINHAHNDYLEFLIEHGVIGFVPLVLLVMLSFLKACQLLRNSGSRLIQGSAFATIMGVLAVGLHATVDYNLQIPANALLFVVILTLPWTTSTIEKQRKPTKISS